MVTGWKLDRVQRDELLARFRPRYAKHIADHVTLKVNLPSDAKLPPPVHCCIVGRTDDGKGVEAMVVEIDGTTVRPGGGTFHITWSLAEGRKAKESNDVIAARGWQLVDEKIDVKVEPASFG